MAEAVAKGHPRVFVYGSLKLGHSNSSLLANCPLTERSYIEGPYRMMGLGFFPGVCESSEWQEEPARMYGEVYSVTPEVLHSLDLLEGHPHFYKRVKVRTSEGTRVWVYILQDTYNPERAVESGLWHPTEEEAAFWSSKEDASDAAA